MKAFGLYSGEWIVGNENGKPGNKLGEYFQ
jgi:hypothetical protein